jgi:hypothetical protein
MTSALREELIARTPEQMSNRMVFSLRALRYSAVILSGEEQATASGSRRETVTNRML